MLDLNPRLIVVLIAFPIVVGIFVILGILVLRKDINYWGNRLYALFFWIVAAGLAFNVVYALFDNLIIIRNFNITTIECVNIGIIALFLGNLVIYKGEHEITRNKRVYFFGVLMILTIIAHICTPKVITSTEEPQLMWKLPFGLFELIFSQMFLGIIIYFSLIFYRELTPELQKKFRRYIIGLTLLDVALLLIILGNMHIIPTSEISISIILFLCLVLGALLIYLGIVRQKGK